MIKASNSYRLTFLPACLLFLWMTCTPVKAQVRFEKSYTWPGSITGYKVIQTPDEGFLVCGTRYLEDVYTGFLSRLSAAGDTSWVKWLPDGLYDFVADPAGGYLFTGFLQEQENRKMLIMKTDANGNVLWKRGEGIPMTRGLSVCNTPDSGFCLVGQTTYDPMPGSLTLVVRADRNGDTLWTRQFGDGTYNCEGLSIIAAGDGEFTICGARSNPSYGGSDGMAMHLDAGGNPVWVKYYDHSYPSDMITGIAATADGGYLLTGSTRLPGNSDQALWLIRTDAQGDTLWTRIMDTLAWATPKVPVTTIPSGGFALTGAVYDGASGTNNMLLIKLDGEGNLEWREIFGSTGDEYGWNLTVTSDSGFALCGSTWNSNLLTMSLYLAKTDRQGAVVPVSIGEQSQPEGITLFPNPVMGPLVITSRELIREILITGITGNQLLKKELEAGATHASIDISDHPSGVYIVQIRTASGMVAKKLIKL